MLDEVMRHTAQCERPRIDTKHNSYARATETRCRDCGARAITPDVKRTPNGETAA